MEINLESIGVTEDLQNMKLPAPELINFYNNLKNRVIWLEDDVAEQILEYSKYIIQWNREDEENNIPIEKRKPIKIVIFSQGGDLNICYHFIDIIEMQKTPVWGISVGLAMSAAFFIQLACHKRLCTKNSVVLIHQGSGRLGGNAVDMINGVRNYESKLKKLKNMIIEKTKITTKTYNQKANENWYIEADEQVKYGIVEGIVENISDLY